MSGTGRVLTRVRRVLAESIGVNTRLGGTPTEVADGTLRSLRRAGYVLVPREALSAATNHLLACGDTWGSEDKHIPTLVEALSEMNAPVSVQSKATR